MGRAEADLACDFPVSPSTNEDADSEEFDVEDYQRALTALQVAVLKNHVLARALADARASASAATRCRPSKEASATQAKARSAVALFKWQRRLNKHHKAVVKAQAQTASLLNDEVRKREIEVHALAGERQFLERTAKYYQSIANRAISLIEEQNGTFTAEDCFQRPNQAHQTASRQQVQNLQENSSLCSVVVTQADGQHLLESFSPATSAARTASPSEAIENDENACADETLHKSEAHCEAEIADSSGSHDLSQRKAALPAGPLQDISDSTACLRDCDHSLDFAANPQRPVAGEGASSMHQDMADGDCHSSQPTSPHGSQNTCNSLQPDHHAAVYGHTPESTRAPEDESASRRAHSGDVEAIVSPTRDADPHHAKSPVEPSDECCSELAQGTGRAAVPEPSADASHPHATSRQSAPEDAAHEQQLVTLQTALEAAQTRVMELEEREERRDFYLLASISPEGADEAGCTGVPPMCTVAGGGGRWDSAPVGVTPPDAAEHAAEFAQLTADLRTLQQDNECLVAAAAASERSVRDLEVELEVAKERRAREQQSAEEVQERCEAQEAQLATLRAELAAATLAVAEASQESGKLLCKEQEKITAQREETLKAQAECAALRQELEASRTALERQRRERDAAVAVMAVSERDCEAAREQRDGAVRAAARLQEVLRSAETKCEGLKQEAERTRGEATAAEQGRLAAVAQMEECKRRSASLATELRGEVEAAEEKAVLACHERDIAVEDAAAARHDRDVAGEEAATMRRELEIAAEEAAAATRERNSAVEESATAMRERDAAVEKASNTVRDRDAAVEASTAARNEQNAAVAEAAAATAERDDAAAEAAAARCERDAAVEEAAAVRHERDAAAEEANQAREERTSAVMAQAEELGWERQRVAEMQAEVDGLRRAERERMAAAAVVCSAACQTDRGVAASAGCQAQSAAGTCVACQTEVCASPSADLAGDDDKHGAHGALRLSHGMGTCDVGAATVVEPRSYHRVDSDEYEQEAAAVHAGTAVADELAGAKQDAARAQSALVAALQEAHQLRAAVLAPVSQAVCAATVGLAGRPGKVNACAQTTESRKHAADCAHATAAGEADGGHVGVGLEAGPEAVEARAERQRLQKQVAELQHRCQELEGAGAWQHEFRAGFAAVKLEIEGLTAQLAHAQDAARVHAREAEQLRRDVAAATAAADAATDRRADLQREVWRLQQEAGVAAGAAQARHAALECEAERLQRRVRELEGAAAADSEMLRGLREDLAAVEERYGVLQAAEAREVDAADELRGRLAEAQAALEAETAALERARVAEEDLAERLRRERMKFKRFRDTFGSMVAMQAQRLAPTPAAAPPPHPAPQLPPAPSQSQLSAEWLHAAMAAAAAGAPPPSTCPAASSAHTSPQKLRHAACYAVCDGEPAAEEAVACHVPGGASEDWPGGAAWDGAWTAVEGVDGPAVVQWAQQLLEAQPSGEMPQQAEPVCGACMPQYVRCLQCLQTAQDELHEAEAQLGAAAEMSDLCAEREATLVQELEAALAAKQAQRQQLEHAEAAAAAAAAERDLAADAAQAALQLQSALAVKEAEATKYSSMLREARLEASEARHDASEARCTVDRLRDDLERLQHEAGRHRAAAVAPDVPRVEDTEPEGARSGMGGREPDAQCPGSVMQAGVECRACSAIAMHAVLLGAFAALQASECDAAGAREEAVSARRTAQEAHACCEALRKQLSGCEAAAVDARREVARLREVAAATEVRASAAEDEGRACQGRLLRLQEEHADLRQAAAATLAEAGALRERMVAVEQAAAASAAAAVDAEAVTTAATQQVEELRGQLHAAEGQAHAGREAVEAMRVRAQAAEEAALRHKEAAACAHGAAAEARREAEAAAGRCADLRAALGELEAERLSLEATLHAIRQADGAPNRAGGAATQEEGAASESNGSVSGPCLGLCAEGAPGASPFVEPAAERAARCREEKGEGRCGTLEPVLQAASRVDVSQSISLGLERARSSSVVYESTVIEGDEAVAELPAACCSGSSAGAAPSASVNSAPALRPQRRRGHRARSRTRPAVKCLVSQEAVRCLHHTVAGVCIALPEVYAPRDFRRGFGADCGRCAHEPEEIAKVVDTMGALREGPEAEAAVAQVSSNNQVCLKAALAVVRLLRHARHVAARLQSADAANAALRVQCGRACDLVGSPLWHELRDAGRTERGGEGWAAVEPGGLGVEEEVSWAGLGGESGRGRAVRFLDCGREGAGSCSGSVVRWSGSGVDDAAAIMPVEAVEQTVSGFLDAICHS